MGDFCAGRTAVVTGAGNGLGRSYALALAAAGAAVVVNDIDTRAAAATAVEIEDAGGKGLANTDDICSHAAAGRIFQAALDTYGGLHAVVNNAGICRDRMFASLSEEDWDEVVAVHMKGHFCLASHAARYWRAQSKRGAETGGRIVNTSSGAGLQGSVGQSNYSAAKGAILTLTLVQAAELARYGVTANALAPQARTAMTEPFFGERMRVPEDGGFDVYHPDNVAPLVVWLASAASAGVTGLCFEICGGRLSIADGWRRGAEHDKGARFEPAELGALIAALREGAAPPEPVYGT